MALLIIKVLFEGSAPTLPRIADALAARSGLAVKVAPEEDDVRSTLHDIHGWVAFECDPERRIEIYAYHPGAAKQHINEIFGEFATALPPQFHKATEGYDEPAGKQTLYLRDYNGQHPTLLYYVMLALEDLRGEFAHPLSEAARKDCAQPLTPAGLEQRKAKSTAAFLPALLLGALFLPWTVAFGSSGIDSSRGHLNAHIRKIHAQLGEPGEPEQIGRGRYLQMSASMVAIRCLLAIPATIIALFAVIFLPLAFAFVFGKFMLLKLKRTTHAG